MSHYISSEPEEMSLKAIKKRVNCGIYLSTYDVLSDSRWLIAEVERLELSQTLLSNRILDMVTKEDVEKMTVVYKAEVERLRFKNELLCQTMESMRPMHEALVLYLKTYADVDKHPTVIQESDVIVAVRKALKESK